MNMALTLSDLDRKAKLSSLWIFVFFNMIFRDRHEFGRAGFLEEMMTGVVNGVQIRLRLYTMEPDLELGIGHSRHGKLLERMLAPQASGVAIQCNNTAGSKAYRVGDLRSPTRNELPAE